LGCLVW